ncbi:MAG: TetR/AcrR family transcriptional regulator [bacterium]|nr:TetR/AcrR family transcriptional regulator [bacterium]
MSRHRAGTAVIEKGRKSVDEILDAATVLLAEEGYAQLSTRKVAARAGMRPGNLQYYFPAKREMVRALLDRYLDRSLERLAGRIDDQDPSPEARLRRVIEGILGDHASETDCTLFREIWALAAHDAEVAKAMADFYGRYRAHLAVSLWSVNPQLEEGDAKRIATAVVAMLEGLSLFPNSNAPRFILQPPQVCELVLRLVHDSSSGSTAK